MNQVFYTSKNLGSLIGLVPMPESDSELNKIFKAVQARGIEIPNLYRVLGYSPSMLRAWLDFAWPLRLNAGTPRSIRELLILRGAQRSRIEYEWVHHVPMALEAGVSQEKIDALSDWEKSNLFNPMERSVLQLADEMADGPASSSCVIALKDYFDDPSVVELVLTASFYICVGRFLQSMQVELE